MIKKLLNLLTKNKSPKTFTWGKQLNYQAYQIFSIFGIYFNLVKLQQASAELKLVNTYSNTLFFVLDGGCILERVGSGDLLAPGEYRYIKYDQKYAFMPVVETWFLVINGSKFFLL